MATFINSYGVLRKKPVASAVTQINVTEYREHLSLPFLFELSVTNLQHIGHLRSKLLSVPIISSGTTLALVFMCLFAINMIRQRFKRKRQTALVANVLANVRKPEDALHLPERRVITS